MGKRGWLGWGKNGEEPENSDRNEGSAVSRSKLVHIVDDVPELRAMPGGKGPVLLIALDGFLDAGNASALAVTHLLAQDPGRVVASFDIDEWHDYRARRPPMTFAENRYTDFDAPRLAVRLARDAQGDSFLLMSGPEPDIRWEAWTKAVKEVVEIFGVRLQISIGSVPMAVPHTRPTMLTNHATSQRLLVQENMWSGELRIPSSAQALLELRMGEWGHDSMGFVAHIPHYLAQFDYPEASLALLTAVGESASLVWDLSALHEAASARRVEIGEQIADSADVREVVSGLEQQYDAFESGRVGNLLADDAPLPSGDELGAQFEQFLAELDDRPED